MEYKRPLRRGNFRLSRKVGRGGDLEVQNAEILSWIPSVCIAFHWQASILDNSYEVFLRSSLAISGSLLPSRGATPDRLSTPLPLEMQMPLLYKEIKLFLCFRTVCNSPFIRKFALHPVLIKQINHE